MDISNITQIIESLCKPLLIFLIFKLALITYNLTQFQFRKASTNLLMTIIGSILIHLLCVSGFETAAWLLLAIVPFFFVSIIAFMIITQLINTDLSIMSGSKPSAYNRDSCDLEHEDDCEYKENPLVSEILYNQCDNC